MRYVDLVNILSSPINEDRRRCGSERKNGSKVNLPFFGIFSSGV
jgi:hypothetical protein